MTANVNPVFVLTPVIWACTLSAANTNRDGTGTLVNVGTGDTNGTRIDRIFVQATVTTTVGMIRLYVYSGSGTHYLIKEIAVTAITPSGSAVAFSSEWVRSDTLPLIVLPNGFQLQASTNNAETFQLVAYGGSF